MHSFCRYFFIHWRTKKFVENNSVSIFYVIREDEKLDLKFLNNKIYRSPLIYFRSALWESPFRYGTTSWRYRHYIIRITPCLAIKARLRVLSACAHEWVVNGYGSSRCVCIYVTPSSEDTTFKYKWGGSSSYLLFKLKTITAKADDGSGAKLPLMRLETSATTTTHCPIPVSFSNVHHTHARCYNCFCCCCCCYDDGVPPKTYFKMWTKIF